jgi:nitroreductase
MDNNTLKTLFERSSIRRFTDEPLTEEQLDTLAQAALASPSGMDAQPWRFSFVTDLAAIAAVSEGALDTFRRAGNQTVLDRVASRHTSLFYGAPLVVFITLPISASPIEAGIAAQTLALAAQSMGLGSCIIGLAGAAFSGDEGEVLGRRIGMPDGYVFALSVAIGHPAMSKAPHAARPEKITWIR